MKSDEKEHAHVSLLLHSSSETCDDMWMGDYKNK